MEIYKQLQLNSSRDHGLTLETGIYINKINPGSLAAKEGNLAVGDRVLSVRKVIKPNLETFLTNTLIAD
jgi:discs large protein 5